MSTNGDEIRALWQQQAQKNLPPDREVLARNAAVTATYARLYDAHPKIFKWAGMAAFASHRVGLALLPYEFEVDGETVSGIQNHYDHSLGQDVLFRNLDLIRQTNNNVFKDITWAHNAYLAGDGGLAAVEAGLESAADHWRLRDGFRLIDEGKRLLESSGDSRRASDLIWNGNRLLLMHEQYVTVEPAFRQLKDGFELFLSLATSMNFQVNNFSYNRKWFTSFVLFMWTRGLLLLGQALSLPSISNIKQRWFWCDRSVLKIWKQVDTSDSHLKLKMALLMKGGATASYLPARAAGAHA